MHFTMVQKKIISALGNSLVHTLIRFHNQLFHLLNTAQFAWAVICTHLFTHLLIHSLLSWMIRCPSIN